MSLVGNIILNANSVLLLIVLYIQSKKHGGSHSVQNRLFSFVVLNTLFLLVLDSLSRFDGSPGSVYPLLNHSGNFLVFLLGPVLPSCWLLYAHLQVFHDENRMRRLLFPLAAVCLVNAALTVLTLRFGWYYSIDAGNHYHRGSLFWVSAAITVSLILYTYGMLAAHRGAIDKKYYHTLVFFAVPPLACIALQIFLYGVSFLLNGVVFSLLIVYFNIQNGSMYVDHLTGVNNRKKLELHLQERINASSEKNTFSAILIDLDNFKAINDTYGHAEGDAALETAAKLLKSCLRQNDFIGRFGGDEFCVILNISEQCDLDAAARRIETCLERYNERSGKPYTLSFSMGCAVYDARQRQKPEEFQRLIDTRMYENKRSGRAPARPGAMDSAS